MSHVKTIKTTFGNFNYLKKALENLNFNIILSDKLNNKGIEILIPQSNGYDLKFSWNHNNYNLYIDEDFWDQRNTPQEFMNKIAQRYGEELVITETQKKNFCPINYNKTENGIKTMIVQQWIKL